MKETFMKKFNELDSLCKTIFIQETLDFKSLRIFADTLQLESKSLLLNMISIRNIVTHSKVSLLTINQAAVDALEGFIEGLKRAVAYDLKYTINPLLEVQKTQNLNQMDTWIRTIEDNQASIGNLAVKKHTGYLYDCLREALYASNESELLLYYGEAKRYFESIRY